MLALIFDGWFECRLSTDPDPTDDPRGVSGWTFALAGEPDLDRIIRTQPEGAVRRCFAPPIGVNVREVVLDGVDQADHPLLGGRVELLEDPMFEGRNGLVAEDQREPILPVSLRVSGSNLAIHREHRDAAGEWVADKPVRNIDPHEIRVATGIADVIEYRQKRKVDLEGAFRCAKSSTEEVALQKRLDDFELFQDGMHLTALVNAVGFRYTLVGPAEVRDPGNQLKGFIQDAPWRMSFWMGSWDADVLCGFMKGKLELPFVAEWA